MRRGRVRPATIAAAASKDSGASGLVGFPPAPPPVRGSCVGAPPATVDPLEPALLTRPLPDEYTYVPPPPVLGLLVACGMGVAVAFLWCVAAGLLVGVGGGGVGVGGTGVAVGAVVAVGTAVGGPGGVPTGLGMKVGGGGGGVPVDAYECEDCITPLMAIAPTATGNARPMVRCLFMQDSLRVIVRSGRLGAAKSGG